MGWRKGRLDLIVRTCRLIEKLEGEFEEFSFFNTFVSDVKL
jgi:hypothetical protein